MLFGHEGFWIELQHHFLPEDNTLLDGLRDIANQAGIGMVITNNTHYASPEQADLQDALVCIREHLTVDQPHPARRRNGEYALKSAAQMADLFPDYPEAIANSVLIAKRCQVSLNFKKARLPHFSIPEDRTLASHLREMCLQGLDKRYVDNRKDALDRLNSELAVIERTELAEFFLIVHDIVRFSREEGILCQGRGSAADSIAVYCLGITPVDPLEHNLLFDRFLQEGRASMPDIDLDIQNDRREEVIQYVYKKYGEAHTAMVCNVVTFRPRSALRDLGRVLGFPPSLIDRLAKGVDGWSIEDAHAAIDRMGLVKEQRESHAWTTLIRLADALEGCPRHLSIHVGGMIITSRPLMDIVPLERATMPGRVVVQWNKDDVEDAGLIKIDLLGLGMLALISEAGKLVCAAGEDMPAQEDLPLDDKHIYAMLCRGDSIGCFQVESRAQEQMVHKHQPREFNDIVVQVAIVRPGPIMGNMVHPYLRRRQKLEPVTYLHPSFETYSYGYARYRALPGADHPDRYRRGGFTPTGADRLRRAMTSGRSSGGMAGAPRRL